MRDALGFLAGIVIGFIIGYIVGTRFLAMASTPSGASYDDLEVAVFGLFGAMAGAIIGGSIGAMAIDE